MQVTKIDVDTDTPFIVGQKHSLCDEQVLCGCEKRQAFELVVLVLEDMRMCT